VKNRGIFLVVLIVILAMFSVVSAFHSITGKVISSTDVISDLNPKANPFTLSAWINTTNTTFVQSIYSRWYYSGGNTADPRGFEIVLNYPNPHSLAIWDTYTPRTTPPLDRGMWLDIPLALEAGREYHLILTREGTNFSIYLDGVNKGSINITSNILDVSSVTPRVGRSNYDINTDPVAMRTFQGTIKNSYGETGKVDLYNRVLTQIEMNSLQMRNNSFNNCPGGDSQIIMSLSNRLNSHGALWNDPNYQYKICYDQIFGTSYVGANPHSCVAGNSNMILKLSSDANAHAQSPTAGSYPTSICYGNLSCAVVSGACPSETPFVVSLSDNTNAHLSGSEIYSYPYKICCTPGNAVSSAGSLYSYWTNSTGGKITNSYAGNVVNMVVETGLTSGSVRIEIYEDDGVAGRQNIRTGADAINAVIGSDGKARASWEITGTDIAAGDAYDVNVPPSDSDLEFYMNVSINGNTNVSGILKTSGSEGPHSAPTAVIISPLSESMYFVGNAVPFSQASYGERAFNLNWDVDDSSLDVQKKNASSFTYTYSTPGVKKVTLTATDRSGLSGSVSMNIVILNSSAGIQVIPIIETPGINSKVSSKSVDYAGSHSYVISSSGNPDYNLSCLGGRCPSSTSACPVGFSGTCPIGIRNDLGLRTNYAPMEFNWNFVDGNTNYSEYGIAKTSGTKNYGSSGQKQIQLRINAYSNYSGFTYNPFEITGTTTSSCSSDGKWWTENGIVYNTSSGGHCGGADHIVGGAEDCCPVGSVCTNSGLGEIRCSSSACTQFATKNGQDYMIKMCNDYNYISSGKQTQCEADCNYASSSQEQINAIIPNLGLGESIASITCAWVDNACSAQYTKQSVGFENKAVEYQCIMEVTNEGSCERNEKEIDYTNKRANKVGNSWVLVSDSDSKCGAGGSVKVKCGGSNLVLPFFENYNLIASLLGILLVYAFISFRKLNR